MFGPLNLYCDIDMI